MTALVAVSALVAVAAPVALTPPPAMADVAFVAGGSVNQVYTYRHPEGTVLDLLDDGGAVVGSGVADAQGALLFKAVPAGTGYRVRAGGVDGSTSAALTVTDPDDHPDQAFYDEITLTEGFGYLPTRDGTLLSVNVVFPRDGSPGPWPVVVDYSGYDPSQPGELPPQIRPYPYMGYVAVGVNMRGTTCSGGAFDFFEDLQRTDGYDAIEALAAQDWANGDVGMVGISYSGYSQLYVAATRPPHLRAITPLSPYADTYRSILYPGGVLNDGFALDWATGRQQDARPAAHGWVRDRIAGGDTTCRDNQVMRLQSRDLLAEIRPGRFDERPLGDYLDTTTFADEIEVPTYLAVQFQDEQTGGHAAELAEQLGDVPGFKAVFANGTHADPLGPQEFPRVMEFIDFHVGKRIPELGPLLRIGLPVGLASVFEEPIELQFDRFTGYPDYASALAAYQAEKPIRVKWQVGAKAGREGAPYSVHETAYPAWPIPTVAAERWYLQPDGALGRTTPTVADTEPRGASAYVHDPTADPRGTYGGGSDGMWKRHPDVDWRPQAEGHSLGYTTPAYPARAAYAGTGSVDLWVRSTAADADLEATLTEVRPDGHEIFVQSGWLRASRRALDPARSTVLRPYSTHAEADSASLPAGEFVPVRFELFPFAHIVSPGSRLRLTIDAPGGNQPYWRFDTFPPGATNEVAHSVGRPSSVALPRLPDDSALFFFTSFGTPNPCVVAGVTTQSVSLRNQPCRPDRPARRPTAVTASPDGDGIAVAWAAPPAWPGEDPPTGYRVTVLPGGAAHDVPADATTFTFTDAVPGERYAFVVAALFDATPGPASDASLGVEVATPGDGERFLAALYPDLLGRAPDAGALAYWLERLDAGTSRTRVAASVSNADEYRRRVVTAEYRSLLGRNPDASGLASWAEQLRRDPRVDRLRSLLLASGEFWGKAGATPSGYIDALYAKVLGRSPDAGGRAYMESLLASGRPRADLAAWLVATTEADTRLVRGWYGSLLDRRPSAAEAGFWVQRLRSGRTEVSIVSELCGSGEYLAKA